MNNLATKLFLPFLSGLFCVFPFDTAVGQIDITFSDGSTTGTSFNVDVGTSQTISVFASETLPGTALTTDGLLGFGFEANASATSGTAASINGFAPNSAFVVPSVSVTPSSVDAQAATLFGSVSGTSVFLGDLDLSVTAPGSTVFTFEDRDPDPDRQDFGSSTQPALDSTVFQGGRSFSFTINAISSIPEPSSGLLIGFSMLATMVRRRRNRS